MPDTAKQPSVAEQTSALAPELTPGQTEAQRQEQPQAAEAGEAAQPDTPPPFAAVAEPLPGEPVLLLCGSGPEAAAVAWLASACGFIVDVVDDVQDTARLRADFPTARACMALQSFNNLVESCRVGREHLVAIMTHDPDISAHVLSQTLVSHASYLGMLAGRRKREYIYDLLRAEGAPLAELAAVRCPVGLAVGASSPQQIAVAVVAELLAARAGTLQRLRLED
ncbi:MAG: XdhC family protein [Desulfovibrio sp.]|nr:XdhC family protein [Desulfovibrio sp.]